MGCRFDSLPNDGHWRWVWVWSAKTISVWYIHLSSPVVLCVNKLGSNELHKYIYFNMVSNPNLRTMYLLFHLQPLPP